MWQELLNKDVVVVMRDGFRKIGKLREAGDKMISLEFYDGRHELINIADINKIFEVKK
ncbi:MAG: hypothetical protein QXS81_04280 [Candidatus Micrarchaeaceae archaeon]